MSVPPTPGYASNESAGPASTDADARIRPAAMMELAQGSALGQYVILDRLGRGATSAVYRAHHPALDREVAIKVLWSPLAEDPEFQERFRREARSVSRLRHPNVLTVYDFGTHDSITYMVMELLPGGTLADRLSSPLPPVEAGRILKAVAAALDHAHASGVIHRDVKPSNILFTRDDEPVLSDFGIARLVDAAGYAATGGGVKGTPTYMSPEQADGKEVRPASDLYSLGVVLFEMLTGRPPFQSDNWVALMRAHAEDDPPHARSLNPSISAALDEVLMRALAKDPDARYPTGAALVEAFEAARTVEDETPTPHETLLPPPSLTIVDEGVDDGDTLAIRDEPTVVVPPRREPLRRRDGAAPVAPAPRSLTPLLLLLAVLLLSIATGSLLGIAIWERFYGPFWSGQPTPTPVAPTPTPVVSVPPPQPPTSALQQQPVQVAQPTAPAVVPTPTPVTTQPSVPRSTGSPEPIPPSAPAPGSSAPRGPLAVELLSPLQGDQVPARPLIRGRRTGLQGPDEHLWLLVHPLGPENLWWPYQRELIADATGVWEVRDAEIGGPPGSQHELLVGVVDATGHRALVRHVEEQPGRPLSEGFPPGFRPLARVTVTKAAS